VSTSVPPAAQFACATVRFNLSRTIRFVWPRKCKKKKIRKKKTGCLDQALHMPASPQALDSVASGDRSRRRPRIGTSIMNDSHPLEAGIDAHEHAVPAVHRRLYGTRLQCSRLPQTSCRRQTRSDSLPVPSPCASHGHRRPSARALRHSPAGMGRPTSVGALNGAFLPVPVRRRGASPERDAPVAPPHLGGAACHSNSA